MHKHTQPQFDNNPFVSIPEVGFLFFEEPRKTYTKLQKQAVLEVSKRFGLPADISMKETMYMIRKGLTKRPVCKRCGDPVKFIDRYGIYCSYKCSAKSAETQNKKRSTNFKKYGTINAANINKTERNAKHFEERLKNLTDCTHFVPLFSCDDFVGGLSSTAYDWKCKRCGIQFKSMVKYVGLRCPKCDVSYSDIEFKIKGFLDSIGINYQPHNRKILRNEKLELDFFLPDSRIAVEAHGLYFHDDLHFPRDYHQEKYKVCRKKNIQLLQFLSDEIEKKFDAVKNTIELCCLPHVDCSGLTVSHGSIVSDEFFEKYDPTHRREDDITTLTASINNEPIGAVKARQIGDGWKMYSFCCKFPSNPVQVFARILREFEDYHRPKLVELQADARLFSEDEMFFAQAGFEYNKLTPPSCYIVRNGKARTTIEDIALELGISTDVLLSTAEQQGFRRVWDAGQHIFTKTY